MCQQTEIQNAGSPLWRSVGTFTTTKLATEKWPNRTPGRGELFEFEFEFELRPSLKGGWSSSSSLSSRSDRF